MAQEWQPKPIDQGGYSTFRGPSDPKAMEAVQATGASGNEKYWVDNKTPTNPGGIWWYDFTAEKADITKSKLSDQYGTGGSSSGGATSTSTSTKTTSPSTRTTTFDPTQTKPEMGELTFFNIPDRPDVPSFNLPEQDALPEFVAPEAPILPEFTAPERDELRQRELEQKAAAPGVRLLREAQADIRASVRRRDDPQGRQTLREALRGYGTNLEGVMSEANKAAQAQYNAEYNIVYDASSKNWTAQVQQTRDEYGYEYGAAEKNWTAAVQSVRDKYAGQMEARKAEYNAELDAVNRVFFVEVEGERQRVASENLKVTTLFETSMDEYLKTFRETVSTTGGNETIFKSTTDSTQKPYWQT